jgi:YHS domain-containing protein
MKLDVVCHMKIDENDINTSKSIYNGKNYYFCTNLCMVQFESDPEKYIKNIKGKINLRKHKGTGNLS